MDKQTIPPEDGLVVANEIAELLGEIHPKPRAQIREIVKLCGIPFVQEIYQAALEVESQGGMMLPDNSRRRTLGGVFFFLARTKLSREQIGAIFYGYGRQKPTKKTTASPAPAPKPPPLIWDERAGLIQSLLQEQGEVASMKITLIGRPGRVETRDDVIVTTMSHIIKNPSLPKGVPVPPSTPTLYTVYIALKQWKKVKPALDNPTDDLIIEGMCAYDDQIKGIAVFATHVTSKQLEVQRREEQKGFGKQKPAPEPTQEDAASEAVTDKSAPIKPRKSRIVSSTAMVEPTPLPAIPAIPNLPTDVSQKLGELYASASLFRQKLATLQSKPPGQQFGLEITQKLLKNVEDEIATIEKKYS